MSDIPTISHTEETFLLSFDNKSEEYFEPYYAQIELIKDFYLPYSHQLEKGFSDFVEIQFDEELKAPVAKIYYGHGNYLSVPSEYYKEL